MDTIRLFRTLVVASLLLYYAFFASFIFSSQLFGDEQASVLAYNGRGALLTLPSLVFWSLQFLWAVSAVGMVLFQRWARTLFVLLTVYSFFGLLAGGLLIQTGSQAALFLLVNLADGAVLFMAYLSSIAPRFVGAMPNPAVKRDAPQAARPLP